MIKKTLVLLLISLCGLSFGQSFRFNQYTTEDGISQDFIYSISQDDKGYLWVGTGEGLCKFDGKYFETYTVNDGLAEEVITCSFVDQDGGQWFGHNEGGITRFKSNKFEAISRPDIIESTIKDISGVGERTYGIAQNHGLFEIKGSDLDLIGTFDVEGFNTLQCIDEKNMVVGTAEGLLHLHFDGGFWKLQKRYYEETWITDISPSKEKGIYIIAMQDQGLARMRLNEGSIQFSTWDSEVNLSELQIQTVIQDDQLNLWLGTYGAGLVKLHADTVGNSDFEITRYDEGTGLSSNYVQSVFIDREGNVWVGTFGAGLSTLLDDFFTFYSHDPNQFGNDVSAIHVFDREKWYGVENGLIRISPEIDTMWAFYDHTNGFTNDKVTSLYKGFGKMWIGTEGEGMYAFDFEKNKMERISWSYGTLQNKINQISGDNEALWIGTDGGLITYNVSNGQTNLFDTELGLAHNAIKSVYVGSDGTVWMGTRSRFLYGIKDYTIDEYEILSSGELEILDIVEDANKDLWLATSENGIFRKTGASFSHFTAANGLKSNYTYAVHHDINGAIWVGHRGALSRIDPGYEKVDVFDHKSGINGQINFRAMYMDDRNYLWMGSENGAIKYDASKDKKTIVPPKINLLSVLIGDKEYSVEEAIDLPYSNYRVHFSFIGISFKNPDKVKYRYRLKGYDEVYSDLSSEPTATYGRLADGEYEFEVIACTEDGVCSESSASIQITIARPFWKTVWFWLLVLAAVFGAVILVVRQRIKRFQANQRYLEEQLAIKTKEVVEKADIIQEINKDLTASINYAERIQSSILPKPEVLSNKYPNSFIFFRPRDIVSGDFYFIREYEDKMIVACVDCTGHGVPGAFMSMIGSTTLRNIYKFCERTGNWLMPHEVMEILDEEIQKILHQKSTGNKEEDFFKSRDGMDMTLAQIDHPTKTVHLASAKRHSILMNEEGVQILSGDKRPIGGGEIDQVDFTLQSHQMKEGDALFLFSDGYPDQFGGADMRKMKLSGVKQIISGLQDIEKDQYANAIASNFDVWKSTKDQIDDVLMIGILF